MQGVKHKNSIIYRLASIVLTIALIISMLGSIFSYALAAGGSLSLIGTNKALGSPILNESFSLDDWNKWEMIVWGIFLSNFTTPFVDDYNSAFNLNSGYGSKGSGVKALEFGTGRDPANSKVIQDLLDYAINQQSSGATKQIYVSFNTVENAEVTAEAKLSSNVSTSTPSSGQTGTINESQVVGEAGQTNGNEPRPATVRDLMFMDVKEDGTTWAASSADVGIFSNEKLLYTDNYVDLVGIQNASVPTFAIQTSSGGYEVVLDYTNSYDLSLIQTAITKALTGDFKSEFIDMVTKIASDPSAYKVVLDCFGNICTQIDGTYRVIIPASANEYLTTNPSINLVNSLIFNASTNTIGQAQVINNGGQGNGGLLSHISKEFWQSGLPAFSNGFDGTAAGQTLIFYDTDTIVYNDATNGHKVSDYNDTSEYQVNTGDLYKKLFDLDINSSISQPYAFKIEPANMNLIDYGSLDGDAKTLVYHTLSRANQLVNLFNSAPDVSVLTTIKTDTGDLEIFDDPVVVSVQMDPGFKTGGMSLGGAVDWGETLFSGVGKKYNLLAIYRRFVNYTYQAYMNNIETSVGTVSSSVVRESFNDAPTPNDLFTNLLVGTDGGTTTQLYQSFIAGRTEFYDVKDVSKLKTTTYVAPGTLANILFSSGEATMLNGENISNSSFSLKPEVSKNQGTVDENDPEGYGRSPFGRSCKVYTTSEVMRSIANILGVRDGTDFAVYSTYIYLTYLDWYGITGSSLSSLSGNENTSLLNANIFDGNSDVLKVDISKVTNAMTEEQKEKQVLDWTYLMLNPSEGREYRSNMIISGISDWIYDNYQKIVYGNASSYYDTGSGVTSRNSTGFLAIEPYSDNFMTAWFISNYSYFVSILIGLFIILIVIVGVLNKRKISWYMVAIFSMINMLLILPATGEIAPLVSNNFVQNMFSDKMSYWAISEGVTNATMEMDYVTGNTISASYLGSLSQEEQAQVVNMVKNLNTLYTDRSLSIKQDISKKVTATDISVYEDVQQLRSARWMLPMIMRQFTANDGSANYVFIPLADKYEDLSNWYWYYNPDEAQYAKTINSVQTSNVTTVIPDGTDSIVTKPDSRKSLFGEYENPQGYTEEDGYWHISYSKGNSNVHTYNYLIPEQLLTGYTVPSQTSDMSYDDWAESAALLAANCLSGSSIDSVERVIELYGGEYNRFDRSTVNEIYGFLWATENPLHYFYGGIKDSFDTSLSVGGIAGELVGSYAKDPDDETIEYRKSFMHNGETGHIRDVLDLEGMFKNMIPYLYAMQLGTIGYGDVAGYYADDDMIEDYEVYTGNNKAWLFRSNWVTKLMENEDYHDSFIIGLADGSEAKVTNMMLPSAYEEAGRSMIFSEAQMYEEGLTEQDLSLIELKCVAVNKEVSRQWTLLVNYVSVPGMTREVMIRQMALDALLVFNEEFSPVGLTSAAFQMYPSGIDLRSISFDSVMKMLMLNVTHDTSYIYGDTMQTIVEDSDIFTSILLLITAFICAFLIPLARNVLMGLIFFLGLWAIIWSIFRTTKTKLKVSCGYVVSNFVFLGLTLVYYAGFSALMAMTTSDEVLSLSQIEVNTGNPVWCLIFVLILSILYCVGIYKIAQLCVRNYRDMGFEVYAGIAEMTVGNISKKMEGLGSKLSKAFTGQSAGEALENSIGGKRTRGQAKKDPVDVRNTGSDTSMGGTGGDGSGGSGSDNKGSNRKDSATTQDTRDDYERSSYTDGRSEIDDSRDSYDIDSKIQRGKEIQIEESRKEVERTRDTKREMSSGTGSNNGLNNDQGVDEYYSNHRETSRSSIHQTSRTDSQESRLETPSRTTTSKTETISKKTEKTRDTSRNMGGSIDNRQNPKDLGDN